MNNWVKVIKDKKNNINKNGPNKKLIKTRLKISSKLEDNNKLRVNNTIKQTCKKNINIKQN